MNDLPVHPTAVDPRTGEPLTALGFTAFGRPIWPVMGGAEETDGNTDPDQGSGDGGRTFTQDDLTRLLSREKDQGKRAGQRELLEALGFTKQEDLTAFVQRQQAAERERMTEAEKKLADAAEREQKAAERERLAAERERVASIRAALLGEGAARDDLDDLQVLASQGLAGDADEAAIDAAVKALKARRPALFTAGQGTGTPPAAPSGGPASPPPAHRPTGSGVFGAAGVAEAKRRGYLRDK